VAKAMLTCQRPLGVGRFAQEVEQSAEFFDHDVWSMGCCAVSNDADVVFAFLNERTQLKEV
jgi:hypothetical protein